MEIHAQNSGIHSQKSDSNHYVGVDSTILRVDFHSAALREYVIQFRLDKIRPVVESHWLCSRLIPSHLFTFKLVVILGNSTVNGITNQRFWALI